MINKTTNELDIVKNLRQVIIEQLNLENNQVLNALSFRGADLHKDTEEFVYKAFSHKDLVIIFELLENDSSNNITYTDDENKLNVYSSYEFKLIIYGNDSGLYSKMLRARLLTDEILTKLEDDGIHIYDITYPSSGTEFINDTIWQRKDLSIYLSVRYNMNKISKFNDFEYIEDIEIIKN